MRLSLALVMAALVLPGAALAQQASFVARVDRTQIRFGESFIYEATVSVGGGEISGFRPPDFRGMRVLSDQPSQSTQIRMGGGASFMQTVYSWRYELQPQQKGNVTVGAAKVRVGDRELRTNAFTIHVSDGSGSGAAAPAVAKPRGGVNPLSGFFSSEPAADGRNFVRVVANKTKAYVGEAIIAEWHLYLTERQDKYQAVSEPRADGFWVEDLPVPSNQRGLSLTRQSHDGQNYLVAPLIKKALFPLHSGRLVVTPLESEISQVDFFGSTVRTERLKTEPLVIEVLPLPAAGQPRGFDAAAVGRFKIVSRVDRDRVGIGEAVTLTVTVSGEGNLRKLTPPKLGTLEGWKVYDPKMDVRIDPGDVVTGQNTAEYLLLPERAGTTTIPAFSLSFFDPATKGYVIEKSAPVRLEVVAEGAATSGTTGTTDSKGPVTVAGQGPAGVENVLGMDIRPLRKKTALRRDLGTTLYRSPWFLGLLAGPPFAFGLTVLVGRVRELLAQDTERARRRKLPRLVKRRLGAAEAHLKEGRDSPFFNEIDRVLREFLSGKLGRPVTGLSREELAALLLEAGVSDELSGRALAALDACDRGRFAPGGVGSGDMEAALEGAGEIIFQIEKSHLRTEVTQA